MPGKQGQELGLFQPAGIEATLEDMNRRVFLQGLGAVTGLVTSATLESWQRLTAALRRPSRVDRQTVAELEHVTAGLEPWRDTQAVRELDEQLAVSGRG